MDILTPSIKCFIGLNIKVKIYLKPFMKKFHNNYGKSNTELVIN